MATATSSQSSLPPNLKDEPLTLTDRDPTTPTTAAFPGTAATSSLLVARDHHNDHSNNKLHNHHSLTNGDDDNDMIDDDDGMIEDDEDADGMAEPFPDVPDHIQRPGMDAESRSSADSTVDILNTPSALAPTMSSLTLSSADHESVALQDDDSNSPRRRRRISPSQLAVLRHIYETRTKYPIPSLRNELAEKLGLRSRMVQVWFQNQRQQEATKRREMERERHRERMAVDVSTDQRLAVLHRQRSLPALTIPGMPHLSHGRSMYQGSLPTSPISAMPPHHALEMVNGPDGTLLLICDGSRSPPPLVRGPDGRIVRDSFIVHGPNPPAPPFRPWAFECPAQWTLSEIPIAGRLGGKRRRRVTVSGGPVPALSKPTFSGSSVDLDGFYPPRATGFSPNSGLHNGIMRRRPRRASGSTQPVWAEYVTSVSDATNVLNNGSAPSSPSHVATFDNSGGHHHPYHYPHHPSYPSHPHSHSNPHHPPPPPLSHSHHPSVLPAPHNHHHPSHPPPPHHARHPGYLDPTKSSPAFAPVEGGRRRSYTTSAMPSSSSLGGRDKFYPMSPLSLSPPVNRAVDARYPAEHSGYKAPPSHHFPSSSPSATAQASPLRYEATGYPTSSGCSDPHCRSCPPQPSSPVSSSSMLPPPPPPPPAAADHTDPTGRAYSSSPCNGPCCRPTLTESNETGEHRYDGVLPPPTTLLPPPARSPTRMTSFLPPQSSPPSSSPSYAPTQLPPLNSSTLLNSTSTPAARQGSSAAPMDMHMHSSESCSCCDHRTHPPSNSWQSIQAE